MFFFGGDGEECLFLGALGAKIAQEKSRTVLKHLSGSPGQQEQPRTETNIDFQGAFASIES